VKYGDVRLADEEQFSVYNFEAADVEKAWAHFDLYEAECKALLEKYATLGKEENAAGEMLRFPVLGAYDLCLKCSHLFNILDARGAISVTERVGVIGRVRALAVGIARAWVRQQTDQQGQSDQSGSGDKKDEPAPASGKQHKPKIEALSPVLT
jgi:glycyl-tRNA synthetase alpha chain